jgi:hypothetical protein
VADSTVIALGAAVAAPAAADNKAFLHFLNHMVVVLVVN